MSPKVEAIVDKIEKLSESQRAELADGLEVLFDLKPEVPEWAMTAKERWEQRIAPVIEAKWRRSYQDRLESDIKKYKSSIGETPQEREEREQEAVDWLFRQGRYREES